MSITSFLRKMFHSEPKDPTLNNDPSVSNWDLLQDSEQADRDAVAGPMPFGSPASSLPPEEAREIEARADGYTGD